MPIFEKLPQVLWLCPIVKFRSTFEKSHPLPNISGVGPNISVASAAENTFENLKIVYLLTFHSIFSDWLHFCKQRVSPKKKRTIICLKGSADAAGEGAVRSTPPPETEKNGSSCKRNEKIDLKINFPLRFSNRNLRIFSFFNLNGFLTPNAQKIVNSFLNLF